MKRTHSHSRSGPPRGVRGASLLLLALAGLVLVPSERLRAQDTVRTDPPEPGDVRVGIQYTPGYLPRMALPPITVADPSLRPVAARIDSILRQDLDFSDRFDIMDVPDSVVTGEVVNYGLWDELDVVYLVTGNLSGSRDAPMLRVTLHDVVYSRLEEVQAFRLPAPGERGFRMAVHQAADAVVRWATGEPGMAATRIAFRRRRADGTSDVYLVDSDGRNLQRITSDSTIAYSPAFSPDARRLMYVIYHDGQPEVYERDLPTGDTRVVADRAGLNTTPAYSPTGRKIMVAQSIEGGSGTDIFEMGIDPVCCRRRVTRSGSGDAVGPSYAPDGSRLAFTGSSLGPPQVFVQDVEGSSARLVSGYVYGEGSQASSPDWSPLGDRIVYHAGRPGAYQIVVSRPDGTGRRQLTSRGSNEDPSWAPDGRHVVFASDREGYRALWILDTVTGRIRSVTVNQVDQMPAWSPHVPLEP